MNGRSAGAARRNLAGAARRNLAGAVRRRLHETGGRAIRRLGLLPAGVPDDRGQDAELVGAALGAEILVHFPDTLASLYQLSQWYATLRALHRHRRVAILVRDSRVADRVRAESGLPVYVVAQIGTLDGLLRRSDVRLALYVNHSPLNFRLLRFASLAHVSLLHGDSDKVVSISNQTKAYDFAFVAGRAAIDRARRGMALYDVGRMLPVGRPNLDAEYLEREECTGTGGAPDGVAVPARRETVLYAPTWEGAQVTASYGSVASHGEAIVSTLLAAGYRTVYRPHPLTGVRLQAFADADRRIREQIAEAARAEPDAGHRVDTDIPVPDSFDGADLLICDVSAMSTEWLATGRPLILTVPESMQVEVASTVLERVVPRLTVTGLPALDGLVEQEIRIDPTRDERLALVDYYVGDTAPGASLRAFLAAVDEVVERRDREWARVAASGGMKP